MARVPIIRVGDTLIAAVQEELYDHDALRLQDDLGQLLERGGVRGVLLDFSTVSTVDSFLARLIGTIAGLSRLLGAETVVVGLQPAVAVTLVEFGLTLPGIRAALTAEKGLALLAQGRRDDRFD